MDSRAMPVMELRVKSMTHQLVQYLGIEGSDLEVAVTAEIERQMKDVSFEPQIREAAQQSISNAIEQYFKWGAGAKFINRVIDDTLNQIFKLNQEDNDE